MSDMLSYGCTRLEIGVQSVYEDVARDTNRGHTVKAVCESFHLAKDAGFKVVAHMMPDLPNMGLERDTDQFVEFFENPAFRPAVTQQLKQLGHSVDKVEFIVMGGTFMALPEDYRDYFIRNLHDALSGHTSNNVACEVNVQTTQVSAH